MAGREMTTEQIDQIITKCREQQEILGNPDAVVLFLVHGEKQLGDRIEALPGGPVGEVVGEDFDGNGLRVIFRADEVIEAMESVTRESALKEIEGGN